MKEGYKIRKYKASQMGTLLERDGVDLSRTTIFIVGMTLPTDCLIAITRCGLLPRVTLKVASEIKSEELSCYSLS